MLRLAEDVGLVTEVRDDLELPAECPDVSGKSLDLTPLELALLNLGDARLAHSHGSRYLYLSCMLPLTDLRKTLRPHLGDHAVSARPDCLLLFRSEAEVLNKVVPVTCVWVIQWRLVHFFSSCSKCSA